MHNTTPPPARQVRVARPPRFVPARSQCRRARDAQRTTGVRGFTFVELMVVVGIIAVLVALLLPLFGRLRSYSRFVACKSNLRQILAAHAVYVADNGGVKPPLWLRTTARVQFDYVSPDVKWSRRPVGQ